MQDVPAQLFQSSMRPWHNEAEEYDPHLVRQRRAGGGAFYAATFPGVMKVFMFDKVSEQFPSFGALPRNAWMALGVLELVCTVGLIVPAALVWQPALTVVAATVLTIESLVFVWMHAKYGEVMPIILSGVLGFLFAFIAYGRMVLKPIF